MSEWKESAQKVEDMFTMFSNGFGDTQSIVSAAFALKGVLELHHPMESGPYCESCYTALIEFPCPTFQAIRDSFNP